MSILLLLLGAGLVIVVAGVWVVGTLLTTAGRAVGWLLASLFGDGGGRPRIDDVARCPNDKCGAPWRPEARFCARCGQAKHGLRIARVA